MLAFRKKRLALPKDLCHLDETHRRGWLIYQSSLGSATPTIRQPHDISQCRNVYSLISSFLRVNIPHLMTDMTDIHSWSLISPIIRNYPHLNVLISTCTMAHILFIHHIQSLIRSPNLPRQHRSPWKSAASKGIFRLSRFGFAGLDVGKWVDIKVLDTSKYSSGIVKQRCHILGYIYM